MEAIKDVNQDGEINEFDFDIPQKARRLAAGPFHSIVCSNVKIVEGQTIDASAKDQKPEREESIWGFGSNRNYMLGWYHPPVSTDDWEMGALGVKQDIECRLIADKPTKLRFDGQSIYEVCCGGNHTVILQKKGDQQGGQVYAMGLGTCGRLGVERPTKLTEKEAGGEDRSKSRQSCDNRTSIEALLQTSLLPAARPTYKDVLITLNSNREEDEHRLPRYCYELLKPLYAKKWALRDPVRVIIGPDDAKVTRIACGVDHTLAITASGAIYAWGLGSYGNLGNGSTEDAPTPQLVKMPEGYPAVQVAAGMKHSMALVKDGSMYSWGHGGNGRLGQGEKTTDQGKSMPAALTPQKIMGYAGAKLKRMKYIAASEAHSASIDELGNLYTWGAGSYGRTGHGEEDIDNPHPKTVSTLEGTPCIQVELGVLHSLALTKKGTIYGWGTGYATGFGHHLQGTPLKVKSDIHKDDNNQELYKNLLVEIACGAFHSMALSQSGDVFIWGAEAEGRLGAGDKDAEIKLPRKVMSGDTTNDLISAWQVRLDNDGDDQGTAEDEHEEEELEHGERAKEVYAGGSHSATLLVKREVWLWGSNEYGQIGNGKIDTKVGNGKLLVDADTPQPLIMERKFRIVQVALGVEHCLVRLKREGDGLPNVMSWGRNSHGQLGRPTQQERECWEPHFIEELKDCLDVAAGEEHSGAILSSGDLYTWGSVENGKLGHDGAITPGSNHTYPDKVNGVGQLMKVSCGSQHTAVLDNRQIAYTWGAGWFGRLGHGDSDNEVNPKELKYFGRRPTYGSETVTRMKAPRLHQIICASYHTAFVTDTGQLWLVGREACVCEPEHTLIPLCFDKVTEPDGSDVQVEQYCAGPLHSLLLSRQRNLYVWGENYKGQLTYWQKEKSSTTANSPQSVPWPVRLENLKYYSSDGSSLQSVGVLKSIATGTSHTVACNTDGELYSWGLQTSGRLAQEQKGSIDRSKPICPPKKVQVAWKEKSLPLENAEAQKDGKEDDEDDEDDKDDDDDDKDAGKHGASTKEKFLEMQEDLKREHADQKEAHLKAMEVIIFNQLKDQIDNIFTLWDKPQGLTAEAVVKLQQKGEIRTCEWYLRWLERKMDRSLCRNLARLDLIRDYPDLDKITIPPEIQPKLLLYEELMWILQQQPCYLANVSRSEIFSPEGGFIRRDQRGDNEETIGPEIFKKVVSSLFTELSNSRIRHLFMALIRAVIKHEIKDFFAASRKPEDMFKPAESTAVLLTSIFIKHRVFKSMHMQIVGDDDQSLLMLIERWTVRAEKKKTKAGSRVEKTGGDTEALFALNVDDVKENERVEGMSVSAASKKSPQFLELMREHLSEHQSIFQRFLGFHDDRVLQEDKDKSAKKDDPKKKIVNSFNEFLDTLTIHPDMQALLAWIHQCLKASVKKDDQKNKEVLKAYVIQPLTRFMMVAVIGEIMEHHQKNFTPAMEAKTRKRWKDFLMQQNPNWGDPGQEKDLEKKLSEMSKRMHFNISNLGKFMRLSAHSEFDSTQQEAKQEGEKTRKHLDAEFTEKAIANCKDETETQLTIDLYTSHYDLDDHRVFLDTTDLLELSNVLWLFKDKIMLLDRPEDDKLYKLLEQIQPAKPPPSEDITLVGRAQKKEVKVIAIATNEEDITKDGRMILVLEKDDSKKDSSGPALPCGEVEKNEDLEEAVVRIFKEKTNITLSPNPEMRLVYHKTDDSNVQYAVFVLREQVTLPKVEKGDAQEGILPKDLTDQKWVNDIRNLHEKQAIQNYLDWFKKREPWDKFPAAQKTPDLLEIRKRLWTPAMLGIVRLTNNQHNFLVPHRFLEKQRDLCFCRECLAPIPRSLSPQNQRGRTELRLVKTYQPVFGKEIEGRYPLLEMERLLANPELDSLKRSDYLMVKYDLEEQQKGFTQNMNSRSASADGKGDLFTLVKAIEEAKKNIDLLRLHNISEDKLRDHIKESIVHREKHFEYLRSVNNGLKKIRDKKEEHEKQLHTLVVALKWAVEASEEGRLPQQIRNKATDAGETLTMIALEKQLKAQRKREQTDDDVVLYPSQTFSAAFLRGKRVISTLGDPQKMKSELECIRFTFTMTEKADWKVRATHKRKAEEHVIFSFEITADKIEDMKRSGKTAKESFHNGFVTFNCFYLVQLLSRVASSMA